MYFYRLKPSSVQHDKDIRREIYSYVVDIDGDKKIELYIGERITKRTDPIQKRLDRIIRNDKHNENVRYSKSGQDSSALTPHSQHHISN